MILCQILLLINNLNNFIYSKEHYSLLDIGRNMDDVTGREREFYLDQLSERQCFLREKIDDEYEAERQA